ncbi:GNAT family N-acetyltransferase [Paenibacillus kobensis]|uniref:GNAT family N-acetyltransferase n=1 Tax=Paenibacillus kobensis TaxID=59841 RepID=UPI000FD703C8|nr:GNAT family protein [Paenibacillus kobensis]
MRQTSYGRIMLREYQTEDVLFLRQWVNHPEIVNLLSDVFLFPQTVNETERFVNAMMTMHADVRGFIIQLRESKEPIGQIVLHHIDWNNRCAEMGIVIADRSKRCLGYGSEAVRWMQRYVFEEMQLNRLELEVLATNESAICCYTACGFIEEGRRRKRHYGKGQYHDTVLMSVLVSDYDKIGELNASGDRDGDEAG